MAISAVAEEAVDEAGALDWLGCVLVWASK